MNFKFTKIKCLISTIIAVSLGIIGYFTTVCFDCSREVLIKTSLTTGIIYFIISLIIIYIIWSLIQKKK